MSSLLATETQNKVAACRAALQNVERHLEPLLSRNPTEVARKLAPLEQAELQVGLAYTVASLYFAHLLTQGVDPAEHPIKQELDRIQLYFRKLKTTKEEIESKTADWDRKRVDMEAAQRAMQHYATAAEAAVQRRGFAFTPSAASAAANTLAAACSASAAEATTASSSGSTSAPAAAAPAGDEGAAGSPLKKRKIAKAVSAAIPAVAVAATAAAPAKAVRKMPPPTPPAAKAAVAKAVAKSPAAALPRGGHIDSFEDTAVQAALSAASQAAALAPAAVAAATPAAPREPMATLMPVEPAGEEDRVTAASLVAMGKAEAARKTLMKKRKAERRAAPGGAASAGSGAAGGAAIAD